MRPFFSQRLLACLSQRFRPTAVYPPCRLSAGTRIPPDGTADRPLFVGDRIGGAMKLLPVGFRVVGGLLAVYATATGGFFAVVAAGVHANPQPNPRSTPSNDLLGWLGLAFIVTSAVLLLAGCLLFTRHVAALRASQLLLFAGAGFGVRGDPRGTRYASGIPALVRINRRIDHFNHRAGIDNGSNMGCCRSDYRR